MAASPSIIAILYPGTMGFSLGKRLHTVGGMTVWR